ncbi:MAG: sodium:proton antiporter [Thermoprotei archaeon]|nr:MAG: sodium:proton antiporter [Thermoprotei archaeon]
MESDILIIGIMGFLGLISVIATYLAVTEKNLVRAVLYSAIQSTIYAFLYFLLMAPDIVLVYVPVAVGLYPAIILFLIRKTEHEERD